MLLAHVGSRGLLYFKTKQRLSGFKIKWKHIGYTIYRGNLWKFSTSEKFVFDLESGCLIKNDFILDLNYDLALDLKQDHNSRDIQVIFFNKLVIRF